MHPLSESPTEGKFWEENTTQQYIDMIASVNTNKGFYISRYEASVEQGNIAQSKRNQMPRKFLTQYNAITYSQNNSTPNTHLMYGIEWDSVVNWLVGNATIESTTQWSYKTMELADATIDSKTFGNYKNATGNAARGAGEIKESGWNEYWKTNNIYNLAGNLWEWTQEIASVANYGTLRGGNSTDHGEADPLACRYGEVKDSIAVSVRLSL